MNRIALLVIALLIPAVPFAQGRRDPLTERESEQLREVADKPDKRLQLYLDFADARLKSIADLRKDPTADKRGEKVHDLLEDFQEIVDETDVNIGDYKEKHLDMRKGLTALVKSEQEWQPKLKELQDASTQSPEAAKEAKDYRFMLTNAIETVDDSLTSARKELEDLGAPVPKRKK
jgi:chromosome segregation ATPase